MLKRLIFLVLAGVWVAGCATQGGVEKDGKRYGVTQGTFRGRWWSYYERGSSYSAGEFYQQAEADLREAVRGRSVDTWTARTYGLHFVEYFPNRELGVACYHMGRLDEAETYLNTSLKQIDTERAHYYLDLIKKARIGKGELKDDDPPALGASLVNGAVLSTRAIPFDIRATDSVGVETVKINGQSLHQRGSAQEVSFKRDLFFDEGTHTINIDAANLAGKASSQSVTFSVDTTGPAIGILEPPSELVTDQAAVKLRCAVMDEGGVATVKVDGKVIVDAKGSHDANLETELNLKNGANNFVVIATDVAGNETRSAVSVFKGSRDKTASFLLNLPDRLLEPLRFAHVRFASPPVYYAGLAGHVSPAVETGSASKGNIEISLANPTADPAGTQNNELKVVGDVVARGGKLTQIKLNDKAYPTPGADKVTFSKKMLLAMGDNPIRVTATDDQGRSSDKVVSVKRRELEWNEAGSKTTVAVVGFNGAATDAIRQSVRGYTESWLLDERDGHAPRFEVLDRTHLAEVLQEQQLSSALGDPEKAIQLKKVIATELFLVCEVIERGKSLELFSRSIDTETTKIISKFDVHIENKADKDKVKAGAETIAENLVKAVPRVTGDLNSVDGENLYLSFAKKEGVRNGMKALIVQPIPPNTNGKTAEVFEPDDFTVRATVKIVNVMDTRSKAQLLKLEGDKLEQGMLAITR